MMIVQRKHGVAFRAQVRVTGFPKYSRTFNNEAEAREWTAAARAALKRGELPDMRERVAVASFGELLGIYQREVTPRKKGAAQERRRIRWIQKTRLGRFPVAMLKTAHVREYRDERLKTGISGSTCNRDLALIGHALKWGRAELDLPVDPSIMLGLKRRENPARERRLQPGELERLSAAAPEWLRHYITIAIETCCRRGELAGLAWSDVDLQRRVITLESTKNGDRGVKVPLSTRAVAALQALNPRGIAKAKLFKMHPDSISDAFKIACRGAGITGLRLHDLRAEGVSRLFERGLDLARVRAVSRHKSSAILRYIRTGDIEELAKALG